MADVRFYHLTRTSLEAALPQMLERTLERDQRAIVMAGSPERVEALNAHLWIYRDRTFLPHGSERDGNPADQPIWLTTRAENPNGAQVLFLTDGARRDGLESFEICAVLFDGNDDEALEGAREQWRGLKGAEHELTYWQQDASGRWNKQD